MRFLLALLCSLLLVSCGGDDGQALRDPEDVARAILEALERGDGEPFRRALDARVLLAEFKSEYPGLDAPPLDELESIVADAVKNAAGEIKKAGVEFELLSAERGGEYVGGASADIAGRSRSPGRDWAPFGLTLRSVDGRWYLSLKSIGALRETLRPSGTKQAMVQMSNIGMAIDMYRLDNAGKVPSTLSELTEPDERVGEPYITAIPTDPWGGAYELRVLDRGKYRLRSNGPDRKPDTEDDIVHPK